MRQKREYGKKPSPPKKALSSFLLYRAEVFDKVKAMNPGLRITELTMIISNMWNNADVETKYRLQQEHEKNKIITAFEKEEEEEEAEKEKKGYGTTKLLLSIITDVKRIIKSNDYQS